MAFLTNLPCPKEVRLLFGIGCYVTCYVTNLYQTNEPQFVQFRSGLGANMTEAAIASLGNIIFNLESFNGGKGKRAKI